MSCHVLCLAEREGGRGVGGEWKVGKKGDFVRFRLEYVEGVGHV